MKYLRNQHNKIKVRYKYYKNILIMIKKKQSKEILEQKII